MLNGQVQFIGTEPVTLPSAEFVTSYSISNLLETHGKIRVASDVKMMKDIGKGYNFYPKSAMREAIVVNGMVVKECNNLLEQHTSMEQLQEGFDKSAQVMENYRQFNQQQIDPKNVQMKFNANELRNALKNHSAEFITLTG